ncbi:MAG: N-acetyltransferase family protein [Polyangiales bacterium]
MSACIVAPFVRAGEPADLPRLLEIYNHYVLHTAITFDLAPITLEARRTWLAQFDTTGRHRLWVAELAGELVGYACTARFRPKAAYDPTVETSVYVAPSAHGHGVGRALYDALFTDLADEDIETYVGAITLPNEASVRLHARFGFQHAGTVHRVGRKHGALWDVAFYERHRRSVDAARADRVPTEA